MNLYIFVYTIFITVFHVSCQLTSTFIKPLEKGTCGISTGGPIVQQLTTTITYAGGLFWSDFGTKIAYVDRYSPAYGRYTPDDGRFNRIQLNEGMEAITIFPAYNSTGLKFVIGLDNRLVLADVTGTGNDLRSTLYDLIVVSTKSEKFMNGKCDNQGRLWYASAGKGNLPTGTLYKIDNLGTPKAMVKNLYCGAGMAWTKDYKYFYLVDNVIGIIYKFDFHEQNGTISNKRIIFRMSDQPKLQGSPFDLVMDTDGYLWIGMLNGGSVIQYNEITTSVERIVAVPASDVVSLEFGGLDKKTLYVGTKETGQISSGAIFSISGLGATGITDNEIVIPDEFRNFYIPIPERGLGSSESWDSEFFP